MKSRSCTLIHGVIAIVSLALSSTGSAQQAQSQEMTTTTTTDQETIKLPAGVYEAIESAIAGGDVEGTVVLPDGARVQWLLDR